MAVYLRLLYAAIVLTIVAVLAGCGFLATPLFSPSSSTDPTVAATSAPTSGVLTTDPPSGVSVMLPTQPSVDNSPVTTNSGATVPTRQYAINLSDGRGQAVFQVMDVPDQILDLEQSLQGLAAAAGTGTIVTSRRYFELDGHPALDARYTTLVDGSPYVGFTRIAGDRGYLVALLTTGPIAQEKALNDAHQQMSNTLRLL